MRKIELENVVWKEGRYYVAWNLNTAVSSFGATREEAMESLQEALKLHLEDIPVSKINLEIYPANVACQWVSA